MYARTFGSDDEYDENVHRQKHRIRKGMLRKKRSSTSGAEDEITHERGLITIHDLHSPMIPQSPSPVLNQSDSKNFSSQVFDNETSTDESDGDDLNETVIANYGVNKRKRVADLKDHVMNKRRSSDGILSEMIKRRNELADQFVEAVMNSDAKLDKKTKENIRNINGQLLSDDERFKEMLDLNEIFNLIIPIQDAYKLVKHDLPNSSISKPSHDNIPQFSSKSSVILHLFDYVQPTLYMMNEKMSVVDDELKENDKVEINVDFASSLIYGPPDMRKGFSNILVVVLCYINYLYTVVLSDLPSNEELQDMIEEKDELPSLKKLRSRIEFQPFYVMIASPSNFGNLMHVKSTAFTVILEYIAVSLPFALLVNGADKLLPKDSVNVDLALDFFFDNQTIEISSEAFLKRKLPDIHFLLLATTNSYKDMSPDFTSRLEFIRLMGYPSHNAKMNALGTLVRERYRKRNRKPLWGGEEHQWLMLFDTILEYKWEDTHEDLQRKFLHFTYKDLGTMFRMIEKGLAYLTENPFEDTGSLMDRSIYNTSRRSVIPKSVMAKLFRVDNETASELKQSTEITLIPKMNVYEHRELDQNQKFVTKNMIIELMEAAIKHINIGYKNYNTNVGGRLCILKPGYHAHGLLNTPVNKKNPVDRSMHRMHRLHILAGIENERLEHHVSSIPRKEHPEQSLHEHHNKLKAIIYHERHLNKQ